MTLSTVRCQILGRAEIHTRGIRLTPESELQFGLALFFCGNPGRQVPRDDVARLFWPQSGLEAARHNLRQSLYRLRVLGVPVRSGAKSSVLETHLVEADFLPVVAEGAPASVYLRMTDVSVLPGYSPKFSRAFARWVEEFRQDIGTRIRRGLVRAISEMRARGRYSDVERLCRFCLILDPLNEEATLALAESVALAGGKAEAVGMIDRYSGEVSRYPAELHLPAQLLRERISDRLIRRSQANMELPMIGREEDVERVMGAYQRLKANRSVSYIVRGASGVGKTRLALECCRIARVQGARVLTIGTQPSSRTQALYTVSELVDDLLQLPGAIGCAPAALQCLREMSAPLGVKQPPLSMETDGEARFAMVRWSILDVLDAILSEGPLLIHVDDAHQVDAQSQLILQDALRTHADRPLLLLLTMRDPDPSDAERFARLTSVSTVHDLSPLNDESCDRLVHRFCAAHEEELDDATRDRIIQLSAGNAFFLLELLKHRSELSTDDLPVSVQALLEDRLARLSPTALTVLRASAVLGLSSTVERLHRLVERKTADILSALTELHEAGMLSANDGATMCRHDSIRDAVLDRTPTAARHLLHRRAAIVLGREVRHEGTVADLWECVHHWRSAGAPVQGLRTAIAFSQRLMRLGLVSDALQVLDEVVRIAESPEDQIRATKLRIIAAAMARHWERVNSDWGQLRTALTQSGQQLAAHTRIELLALEARVFMGGASLPSPSDFIGCIESIAASANHRLEAGASAIMFADNNEDVELARRVFTDCAKVPGKTLRQRTAKLTIALVYHSTFGNVTEAASLAMQLVAVSKRHHNPVRRSLLLRHAALTLRIAGERMIGIELLQKSLAITDRLQLHRHSFSALESLVVLCIENGDYASGRRYLDRLREVAAVNPSEFIAAARFVSEARMAFVTNSPDEIANAMPPREYWDHSWVRRGAHRFLGAYIAANLVRQNTRAVEEALPSFIASHREVKGHGLYDIETAILISAMTSTGRTEEARLVVQEYLELSRRDRSQPAPVLRCLAESLLTSAGLQSTGASQDAR